MRQRLVSHGLQPRIIYESYTLSLLAQLTKFCLIWEILLDIVTKKPLTDVFSNIYLFNSNEAGTFFAVTLKNPKCSGRIVCKIPKLKWNSNTTDSTIIHKESLMFQILLPLALLCFISFYLPLHQDRWRTSLCKSNTCVSKVYPKSRPVRPLHFLEIWW